MAEFDRSEFPEDLSGVLPSRYGTERDVALLTFRLHDAIKRVAVEGEGGRVTVRIGTGEGDVTDAGIAIALTEAGAIYKTFLPINTELVVRPWSDLAWMLHETALLAWNSRAELRPRMMDVLREEREQGPRG